MNSNSTTTTTSNSFSIKPIVSHGEYAWNKDNNTINTNKINNNDNSVI